MQRRLSLEKVPFPRAFRPPSWVLVPLLALPSLAGKEDDGGYILKKPVRTLEEIDRVHSGMPPVTYRPPADRWKFLPRTRKLLADGKRLGIVMLGDSIVNDTSRSGWTLLLGRDYPGSKIETTTSVRGSTGCWWYKEKDRVKKYVLDHDPDLVIIGGISQRDDIDSIREVIHRVRAGSRAEVLLMSGAFGSVDPRDDKQWRFEIDPGGKGYRARLRRLAGEEKSAFIDMHALWGAYIRSAGKELDWFKRDPVHANERGEQILGRILYRHFAPEKPAPGTAAPGLPR